MNIKRKQSQSKAFTLIEIIAALSLSLVAMGILQSSLSIAFKSQKHTQNFTTPIITANAILNNIEQDLLAVLPPTGTYAGAFTTVLDEEQEIEFDETSAITYYTTNPKTTANNKAAFIKQVTLALQPQDQNSNDNPLYSLIKTINTDFMSEIPELQVKSEIVATNIHSLVYEFFDGQEWLEEWDSTANEDSLPIAIKITLVINKTPGQETPQFHTANKIITMPCALTQIQREIKQEQR